MRLRASGLESSALLYWAASPGYIPEDMEQSGGWEEPGSPSPEQLFWPRAALLTPALPRSRMSIFKNVYR